MTPLAPGWPSAIRRCQAAGHSDPADHAGGREEVPLVPVPMPPPARAGVVRPERGGAYQVVGTRVAHRRVAPEAGEGAGDGLAGRDAHPLLAGLPAVMDQDLVGGGRARRGRCAGRRRHGGEQAACESQERE